MKAERRHELQQNTLAQAISDLPLYVRFHANKILIAVIVVCLAVLLVRYRMNQTAQAKLAIRNSLTSAREGIEQLKMVDRSALSDSAKLLQRRTLTGQINTNLNTIFDNITTSDDPSLRAQALIARGDLNWTIACLPVLTAPASQPSVPQQSLTESLQNAEDAYKKALADFDSEKQAKAAALFGLAAIEENRENFDKASAYYNSIIQDSGVAAIYQAVARQRLAIIPDIRKPIYLGSFSSTQPASQPTTEAAAMPSSMPTSAPANIPQ